MDWDDVKPKAVKGITVGDDLSTLAVAELELRVSTLEAEIVRVKSEIATKKLRHSAADELFKR